MLVNKEAKENAFIMLKRKYIANKHGFNTF